MSLRQQVAKQQQVIHELREVVAKLLTACRAAQQYADAARGKLQAIGHAVAGAKFGKYHSTIDKISKELLSPWPQLQAEPAQENKEETPHEPDRSQVVSGVAEQRDHTTGAPGAEGDGGRPKLVVVE